MKKDNFVYHSIGYLGLLGGAITLLYPDFIGQSTSVFYLPTISGLIHHTVMLFLVILLFVTKQFNPTIKKYHYLPLGLCVVMTFGLAIYELCYEKYGLGAMEIGSEFIEGTGLTWIVVGLIFITLHAISLSILSFLYPY